MRRSSNVKSERKKGLDQEIREGRQRFLYAEMDAFEQYGHPTWGNAEIASPRAETKHAFEQDNLPYQLVTPKFVGAHRRATLDPLECASRLLQARPMPAPWLSCSS